MAPLGAISSVRLFVFAALLVEIISALSPISVKGTKLYDEDGKQFFVKGVSYGPLADDGDNLDPLIDTKRCQIDAGLISELGANTIRVHEASDKGDHRGCMEAFANSGIYVWLSLPSVKQSFNRGKPEWTRSMYDSWTKTVDNFAGFNNTLLFTISNEAIYSDAIDVAPYVKAAVRDIKAFRRARGFRPIPLIYASTDDAEVRALTAEYLACGDEEEAIDAFGINVYSWCGESSFYEAGYDKLYEEFQDLHVPVLFSETGCTPDEGSRMFPDVQAMLGKTLQAVFSGVVVYEWAMHRNGYGIVEYPTSSLGQGFPSTLAEYNSLSRVFATMNPSGTSRESYTPSNSPPNCPESLFGWATRDPLPTIRGLKADDITQRASWTESATKTDKSATLNVLTTNGPEVSREPGQNSQGGGSEDGQDGSKGSSDIDKDDGLSGGAIGGIGAGIAVFTLGSIATAVFFWLRGRKLREAHLSSSSEGGGQSYEKSGQPLMASDVASPTPELEGGQQYQELEGGKSYHELDAQRGGYGAGLNSCASELNSAVYELPGGK